jgi:hypothetical protein
MNILISAISPYNPTVIPLCTVRSWSKVPRAVGVLQREYARVISHGAPLIPEWVSQERFQDFILMTYPTKPLFKAEQIGDPEDE